MRFTEPPPPRASWQKAAAAAAVAVAAGRLQWLYQEAHAAQMSSIKWLTEQCSISMLLAGL